jgi:hypothetical protein
MRKLFLSLLLGLSVFAIYVEIADARPMMRRMGRRGGCSGGSCSSSYR